MSSKEHDHENQATVISRKSVDEVGVWRRSANRKAEQSNLRARRAPSSQRDPFSLESHHIAIDFNFLQPRARVTPANRDDSTPRTSEQTSPIDIHDTASTRSHASPRLPAHPSTSDPTSRLHTKSATATMLDLTNPTTQTTLLLSVIALLLSFLLFQPTGFVKWLQKKNYQYEVTFSLYMLTPTEKFVFSKSPSVPLPIRNSTSFANCAASQQQDLLFTR